MGPSREEKKVQRWVRPPPSRGQALNTKWLKADLYAKRMSELLCPYFSHEGNPIFFLGSFSNFLTLKKLNI